MRTFKRSVIVLIPFLISLLFFLQYNNQTQIKEGRIDRIRSSSSPKSGVEMKTGRWEYFQRMLMDPATGKIPKAIRQRELEFAKELQQNNNVSKSSPEIMNLSWKEAGPVDVGGRTRALAVDSNNPNIIIAGGITGGIWKSTDKGTTWKMKSTSSQMLSVTTVVQDPRNGHTNTWYYGTGEFFYGNSAQDRGSTALFSGDGIYKSTDNGETWNILPATAGTDPTRWSKSFDFVLKIIVNPKTGSILVATFGDGIFRSEDGGNSFNSVLGGEYNHMFSDVDISSNGTSISVVSSTWDDVTTQNSPGVYRSTDDGKNWQNITPSNFPQTHYRSIVKIAPSNPNAAYILAFTWQLKNNKYDDVRFLKLNLSTVSSEDRSDNLPIFPFFGDEQWFHTQNNYNMTLAVKPDDENFVLIGATNLYRSTDGYKTKSTNQKLDWIGGYHPESFNYPNLHADIHSYAFDPSNPNAMWWGHDGGLSYTSEIRNTNYDTYFPWENKNNGYNVTQFYVMAIPNEAGDNRIMGGTQDNGSPSFRFDGTNTTKSYDVSSGDGSYPYFGDSYPYVSTQNGLVIRAAYDASGNPVREYPNYSNITPQGATDMLFINPIAVDPNDENIMLYSAGRVLWRNDQLNSLPNNPDFSKGLSQGWTKLTSLETPAGFSISTLAFSYDNPSHRLYYGASDRNQSPGQPKIFRLDNANSSSSNAVDISIPSAAKGAYVHNIAVNPSNGDELLVTFSNYNIPGIYHSTDAGQSFTAVEGNLEGNESKPGPSIRAATILPTETGTLYLVATSIGVFSATQLSGAQTTWTLEGPNTIGNVVVEHITSRKSDGKIVAGTHGRGAFVSQAGASGTAIAVTSVQSLILRVQPGETGTASFELKNEGGADLNFNASVTGNFSGYSLGASNSYIMNKTESKRDNSERFRNRRILNNSSPEIVDITHSSDSKDFKKFETAGDDILFLDDGDNAADNFFGWASGASDIFWYNEFNLSGFNFQLESFSFFMHSNQTGSNDIFAAVYDKDGVLLVSQYFSLPLVSSGDWFTITLNSPIAFSDGDTFFIEIGSFSYIDKPIGVDIDAKVPNKSYFGDGFDFYNLNTVSGAENGAFLIRAIGTAGGGGSNQDPVAVAQVSKSQAAVNESITFDASQSYDNDGQVTQYLWNFGDGNTSNQKSISHSYSQVNTFTYNLTVTDNQGATGQTSGQIIVSGTSTQLVTIEPSGGTIAPGNSKTLVLTLNANELQAGAYIGEVNITSNGGNITLPIDYLVNVEKLSGIPTEFSLSQNYPNPFNPSTAIEFSIPTSTNVRLKIYDLLGKEIITLLDENKYPGKYKVIFNASGFASGVYLYKLETDEFTETKKIIFLK